MCLRHMNNGRGKCQDIVCWKSRSVPSPTAVAFLDPGIALSDCPTALEPAYNIPQGRDPRVELGVPNARCRTSRSSSLEQSVLEAAKVTIGGSNPFGFLAITLKMFGKVPPSNTPGPPSSGTSTSSRTRPTTCLPCFSVDEATSTATEDRSKLWRPKEGGGQVVSEAPSVFLEDKPNPRRSKDGGCNEEGPFTEDKPKPWRSKETCGGAVASEMPSVFLEDKPNPRRSFDLASDSLSTCSSVEVARPCRTDKTKISSKDAAQQGERNHGSVVAKGGNPSVHKCSSNPNCPSSGKSLNYPAPCASRSSRTLLSPNLLSFPNTDTRESRKYLGTNRDVLPLKDQDKVTFKDTQARKGAQPAIFAKPSSCKASEATYTKSRSGTDLSSEDSIEVGDLSSPLVASAIHVELPRETYAGQKSSTRSCKNISGDQGGPASSTCERNSCRGDLTVCMPSKDCVRNNGDLLQQNCISCLPQDLPTEFASSPRSYKDREKCRDPWRPTEMESNIYGLNPCSGDTVQDTGTKRRTGASCQALRHAVASLNRLDDFYMEKIGAGFFSEVFKVTHKVTGQVMVLKMNQLPANRPNMLKEVQLMNKLSHPNILRFMGVCVHEGQLHALTEYINGGSLEQLIMSRHTPLPHLIRMNLAKDVARGMAYLHSRGLFHRDLTSKNVLIKKDDSTADMTAVVGDFGLAAKIPDPSSGYRLSTVGSPYWMSPECLKGQWYDHRSDIFSFGIVVCELIGRVPADPDVLPRSDNFGLDYLAVAEICATADPPPAFLQLAFNCCTYEPKSRPTFPEITTSLESIISSYEEESKGAMGKRQSADTSLMSSMDEIAREGRTTKRRPARMRSQSADARGCDTATPSDKARCHSARRVAELASRRDPHYRPMTANPFHALGGVKKILGDLFSSCLELPSLEDVRPSVTDGPTKFKPAQNDSIAKILDRKKPSSEPSSPTARKKWERKVATKVGAASLFAHPLFRDGWEPRRRGSCESGFWSCVGEDLSPEPPNRRHTSTLSSSAASSLLLLDDHRTSSIYTDSSEDIASLGGGDSSCWEDRLSGIGSSSKTISKIVEYFERKQATAGSLRLGDHDAGPSRIAMLRASLEGPVPLCSISAAQRLVVCEGAVRSKLPLFDKK
ncbi:hypothetical protein KM043_013266 [Ampulex compressa]|nr:hypothetical protein KM043_013266 [Ampulex compressa]